MNKHKIDMKFRILFFFLTSVSFISLKAEVKLARIFSDNMVLQQGKEVKIWGSASKNEQVLVTFGKQTIQTTADKTGQWSITLAPMKASSTPNQLIVEGKNTVTLKNILVGEVWICCGQSNMDYPLDTRLSRYYVTDEDYAVAQKELSSERNPLIRVMYVERKLQPELPTKGWAESNDTILKYVSAVGYFFAKELTEKLKIPVGIISNGWGGTQIENWTPVWAYQQSPVYKQKASVPGFKIDTEAPGAMFESLMKPLIPFSVRGLLWYQGESNCMVHDSLRYTYKFQMLVESYRQLWNDAKMPFYFVQLAPFYYSKLRNNPYNQDEYLLPYTWEAQLKCLKIPETGMVVTTDLVKDMNNIHPGYKWEVGKRLSKLALAKSYGKKIAYSGPIYKSMKVKSSSIELSFYHTGKKLISNNDQALTWFEIAGDDKKFYPATVMIKGKKLIVSAVEVSNPVAVRFAWKESAQPNFYNSDLLPASPFRTDNW